MKKLLSLLIIATIITSSLCVSYFAIDDNSTQNNTESTTVPVTETSSTVTTEPVTESSTDTSSTEPTDIKVNSIKLNTDDYVMYSKQYVQLKATVSPDNATNNNVTWKSSNRNIATVDSKGKVKALKVGNAIITATSVDGSNISAQCKIKVAQRVTKIKLNKGIINLSKKGKTCTVKATVYPNNAYNKYVNWTANNKKVATVDKNGKIKATTNKGTTYVNAIAKDGSKIRTRVLVVVGEKVKKITLNKTSVILNRGAKNRTFQLKKAIKNKNATYKGVSWYSSNKNIATVNSTGKVTIKRRGKVIITVKAKDGSNKSAKCKVTVRQLVTKLSYNKKTQKTSVDVGKTIKFNVVVSPSNANNKGLVFSTSNKKVATVNSKGIIKGLKSGKVVITAKAKDGSKKVVRVNIKVNPKPITMNTKLSCDEFQGNRKYVDRVCTELNNYFKSCGAIINPKLKNTSQYLVTTSDSFTDGGSMKDFLVETVGIWTCQRAKDAVEQEGWKNFHGEGMRDDPKFIAFLDKIEEVGCSVFPTYNPDKMLDPEWNGWKQWFNTGLKVDVYVYVHQKDVLKDGSISYEIRMSWDCL